MGPLYYHLYSAVCSKTILGAFHYCELLRESPKSARDYNVNQLIYGVQECYGSIVVENVDIFILMNKDYFRHQQVLVVIMLSFSISFTRRWMRPWNGARACLKRSAGIAENPGAWWEGIFCINCENSLKLSTGPRIVSPIAIVQKSNIPALSRKVLSFVRCLVLRKCVGSILKHVSPSQKCSMLLAGEGRSGMELLVTRNKGIGPVLPHSMLP